MMFLLIFISFSTVTSVIQRNSRNQNYRWTVLPEIDNLDVCNAQKCDNTPHTTCRRKNLISSVCKNFSMLPMNFRNIQKFVLMLNGLRNRIVRTRNYYVKNMNYLVFFLRFLTKFLIVKREL